MILKSIVRYFWVVNLVLLFLVAYFLAGLVNFHFGKKFLTQPAQAEELNVASLPAGGFNYHPDPSKITERNVFGTIDMTLLQGATALEPMIAKVNATLNGIIYFCQGCELNRATIFLPDQNVRDAYKVGDELPGGAKIEEIQAKKVILSLGGGGKQELLLEEIAGMPSKEESGYNPYAGMSPAQIDAALAERRKSLGLDERIKKVSDTYYKIERSAINDALSDMNSLFTSARMIPNFVEDDSGRRTDGFRVLNVKPGAIFEKLGVRNGDVIKKINGTPMDNVEQAFQLLQQLKFEKRFEIEIFRGARPLVVSYEIID